MEHESDLIVDASDAAYVALTQWGSYLWQRPLFPRHPHVYQVRVPHNEAMASSILAVPELIESLQLDGHSLAFLFSPHRIMFAGSNDTPALQDLQSQLFSTHASSNQLSLQPLCLSQSEPDADGETYDVWTPFDLEAHLASSDDEAMNSFKALELDKVAARSIRFEEALLKNCSQGAIGMGSCWTCGTNDPVTASLKKCTRCKLAAYCSKECQTADWPQHKPYCKRLIMRSNKEKCD